MKIRVVIFIYCMILFQMISGCFFFEDTNLDINQIHEFSKQHNIQPLYIEEIPHTASVLVYRNSLEEGCYITWNTTRQIGFNLKTTDDYTDQRNLTLDLATALRSYNFGNEIICIIINDDSIRSKAHAIKANFPDGTIISKRLDSGSSTVIYRKINTFSTKDQVDIIFYDNSDQEILRIATP